MAYHRCNEGRTLITYCVCGRDATIDESPIIDAALAADRARIAQAIREELRKHGVLRLMGFKASRALTDDLLRVVEGDT